MKHFKLQFLAVILIMMATISSCKKKDSSTSLGGDVNISLTAKDSVTTVHFWLDQTYSQSLSGTMKVKENNEGLVTYQGSVDISTVPDSLMTQFLALAGKLNQAINYYKPKNFTYSVIGTVVSFEFQMRVTSEGFEHYFFGSPTVIRYSDPQGTVYSATNEDGKTFTSSVTEKTGQNDWGPYIGFQYIKTSKIEYQRNADDPVIMDAEIRINHKYGLVNMILNSVNSAYLEMDLLPFFVQ